MNSCAHVLVVLRTEVLTAVPAYLLLVLGLPSCPACDVAEACDNADDCSSDVCVGGICITSYPTPAPSPVPSSSPTWTPCPWLEIPPDPQLESARFSSTGGQLFLKFDSGTDRAGLGGTSFSCDQLVNFPQVSYATCAWTSNSQLTVCLRAPLDVSTRPLSCCALLWFTGKSWLSGHVCPW